MKSQLKDFLRRYLRVNESDETKTRALKLAIIGGIILGFGLLGFLLGQLMGRLLVGSAMSQVLLASCG